MQYFFILIWFLLSIIYIIFTKQPRNIALIIKIALLYALVIFAGIGGIIAFSMHTFFSDQIARQIGWATGSGFQLEVAVANLAFGILGILCIWFRKNFWLATAIGYATFLFGAAGVHIHDIIQKGNVAPLNTGVILFLNDISIPLFILVLAIIYSIQNKNNN